MVYCNKCNKDFEINIKTKNYPEGVEEHLSFSDVMELMKHDSYYRGRGGAIKQK